MCSASLLVSATSVARSSLAWRSKVLPQERQNEADFYPRRVESFLDLIEAVADRSIVPIEPSLDQRLHPIREFEGLALIWPGALRICSIARSLELRLNHDEAISDTANIKASMPPSFPPSTSDPTPIASSAAHNPQMA